jgi:hypothetical protein
LVLVLTGHQQRQQRQQRQRHQHHAIAYGTGLVRLPTMVSFGARLNLLGLVLLIAAGAWFLPAAQSW